MQVIRKVWHYLSTHRLEVFLVLLAATYFLFVYITDPNRPGLAVDAGWLSYFDQSAYLRQAIATAHGNLQEYYVYGPIYPLVAVPLIWLGITGGSAFLPFNLAAFCFIVWAVYRFATALSTKQVGFIAAMALMFATPLLSYMVIPWNSTVTIVATGIVLWAASLPPKRFGTMAIVLLAAAAALAFGSRYIDVVWLFALGAVLTYVRVGWRKVVLLGGVTFLFCVPVFWTHAAIFGSPLKTPYVLHTAMGGNGPTDQQLGAYDPRRIPNAAYGMFVSPILAGVPDGNRGFLVDAFWLVFAFTLLASLRRLPAHQRIVVIAMLSVIVVHALFYLSFRASGPGALKFGTLHYFKTFWPVLTVCATVSLCFIFQSLVRFDEGATPHNKSARQKIDA